MEIAKLVLLGALMLARRADLPKLLGGAPQPSQAEARLLNEQAARSI